MVLVNQHDVVKMNFNSERREVEFVADFMRTYLGILQLAFFYNLISEEQRDQIASAILMAVRKAANEDEVLVSNYVYAISLRFSGLSNYECWELLSAVTNRETAEKFVSETKEWFLNRVSNALKMAKDGYKKSRLLKNAVLLHTWKSCYKSLEIVSGCLKEETKLELKGMHTESVVAAGQYMPLQRERGLTYIDRMENYIQSLWMEVSILIKFDASKIMKAISSERKDSKNAFKTELTPQIETAQKEYDRVAAELRELEKGYEKTLKKIEAGEAIYEELLEKFEQEHPELEEDDLFDAFDQYWMNCPQYFCEDRSEIEKDFRRKRLKLQEEINICRRRIDEAEDYKANVENAFDQPDDDVSLGDILNEYAVVELFKEGRIAYPQTVTEKAAIISRISTKDAVDVFLRNEAEKIHLTAEEKTYLLSN